MKFTIAFIGLILILLSTHLFVYLGGRIDGKANYRHSKNFQMTLDSQYHFGFDDGELDGYLLGYVKGRNDCKANFLKLSHKQKAKWCK